MAIDQGWLILRDQEGDDEVEMSELERNHSALGNVCKVCCFFHQLTPTLPSSCHWKTTRRRRDRLTGF